MRKFLSAIALSLSICMFCVGCGSNGNNSSSGGEQTLPEKDMFDEVLGYTQDMPLRFEIANFQYGADLPYARYNKLDGSSWHARSFLFDRPVYSYTPRNDGSDDLMYKATSTWIDDDNDDDCNYFTVYG